MMNRRNFLKLTLVSTAGILFPLTLINKKEVKFNGEELTIRLTTDHGEMFFKLPAERVYEKGVITWSNMGTIEFEAVRDTTITKLEVLSVLPPYQWIEFDTINIYNIKLYPEDQIHITFNGSQQLT